MELSRRSFLAKAGLMPVALPLLPLANPLPAGAQTGAHRLKKVSTLQGSVAVKDLGFTLMHEHIFWGDTPQDKRAETVEYAVKLINDAQRVVVNTIIDLSPIRDITLHQAIKERVSVNIILATGSYQEHLMPRWLLDMNEKQFKEHVVKELTEGIGGTGIKPGLIKVAARRAVMTDWEKMVFKVAAEVNKELGTPIGTHAVAGVRRQFDHLVKYGATPDKLFFSHVEAKFGWEGRSLEQMSENLVQIANEGGRLLFNNFGYEFDTPWEELVYLIRNLCDKGYAANVMTSMDSLWFWQKGVILTNVEEKHPQTKSKTYAYALTDAVPNLLKAGFSAKEIDVFFRVNPQTYFS